jgi:selenide,water dikinase
VSLKVTDRLSSASPAAEPRREAVRLTQAVECAGCAAKLGPADLREALRRMPRPPRDPRVLVDASTLDDAGVFAFGRGMALVQTVDFFTPIVDDPFDFGRVAAANSVSDIYAMGGRPLTALGIVAFPDDRLPVEVLTEVLRGGQSVMREAGVAILGGHSVRDRELKFGYAVTGVVARRRILTNAGARPGDRLVLTKLLGTGILSTALKRGRLTPPLVRRLTRSMTTLNRVASECAIEFGARAATDVTGFSFLGHASQMADASGVTFRVAPTLDWLLPKVAEFAAEGVVPGGLARNREFYSPRVTGTEADPALLSALYDPQTSGGLLLSVSPRRSDALIKRLRGRRMTAIAAGEVVRRKAYAVEIAAA